MEEKGSKTKNHEKALDKIIFTELLSKSNLCDSGLLLYI